MSSELETRVAALEAIANAGRRTHFIWITGDDEAQAEAAVAARTAAGQIKAGDRVITFCWQDGPETPMGMDIDPFGAAPKPPDPATPWSSSGTPLQVPAIEPLPINDNWFWGPRDWPLGPDGRFQ